MPTVVPQRLLNPDPKMMGKSETRFQAGPAISEKQVVNPPPLGPRSVATGHAGITLGNGPALAGSSEKPVMLAR